MSCTSFIVIDMCCVWLLRIQSSFLAKYIFCTHRVQMGWCVIWGLALPWSEDELMPQSQVHQVLPL